MITKSLQTTTGKIRVNIPTDLSEITLAQMIELESEIGSVTSIVPELTKEVIDNIVSINDLVDIQDRILSLAHQIGYCYQELKMPERVVFGGKSYDVPKNLSIEPAGAYLVSRNLIADEINACNDLEKFRPSLTGCAKILANYFYCRVTGKIWAEQQAEDFVSEIVKLPITVVLPIAAFFFRNANNLYRPKMRLSQVIRQKLNEKRALKILRSSNTSI